MPSIGPLLLGAHMPVTSYVVEIHPDGRWIVNAFGIDNKDYMLPVAEGRGSRRDGGRIVNARHDVAAAIQSHEMERKEYVKYQSSVIRYSVPTNSA